MALNKRIKTALIVVGVLFGILLVIGIFAPKRKEVDESKMSVLQLRGRQVAKSTHTISGSSDDKSFAYDSTEHPHRAGMYLFVDGTKVLDQRTLLKQHLKNSIEYAKEAFQIDGIDTAYFATKEELTTQLGQKDTVVVLKTAYSKATFKTVNWDNLSGRPMVPTIAQITIEALNFMHPAILKKLSANDVTSIVF